MRGQLRTELAVIGEGLKRAFRYGVDRERRDEFLRSMPRR
jgi:hypothetical protein